MSFYGSTFIFCLYLFMQVLSIINACEGSANAQLILRISIELEEIGNDSCCKVVSP